MNHHHSFTVYPIGIARSPYPQKFGIARQSGLVASACSMIELNPSFSANAVRGLDEFDYIWVQFMFHQTLAEGFSELVRPPRLGGKIKKGVFATRAPHRPNHIGLSLLKLEKIIYDKQVKIYVSGTDLLDGTPVLDIKPYLPHLEAKTNARGGFSEPCGARLNIEWAITPGGDRLDQNLKTLIEQTLAQDPRPSHQHRLQKEFVLVIAGHEIRFRCRGDTLLISAVTQINKI